MLEYCEADNWPSNWNPNFKDKICDRFKPCDSCNPPTCSCPSPSKPGTDCVYRIPTSNGVDVYSTTQYQTGDVVWGSICYDNGQCNAPQALYIMNEGTKIQGTGTSVGFSYSKDGFASNCCDSKACPKQSPFCTTEDKHCVPNVVDAQLGNIETKGWPTDQNKKIIPLKKFNTDTNKFEYLCNKKDNDATPWCNLNPEC